MASRDQQLPGADTDTDTAIEKYCPSCDESFLEDAVHCPNDGTKLVRLTPAIDPLIGRMIDGRFRIRTRLGQGGMGAVYRAWQGSVGRDVAIKVIEARLSQGKMAAKRFLRESKLSSRLSHPNTVTVLEFGQTEDGLLYLVMELIKGRTLARVLKDDGRFSIARMVRVGVQLCDALDAAHRLSIIHRDLKPSNIIVLDDLPGRDHVKVLDFGLAKSLAGDDDATTMTHSNAVMGTPAYISPEAVLASKTDARTDLYSLGVILYELVAGRLPFFAETINVMMARHAHDAPEPLGDRVPAEVQRLLMRLLAKKPDDRYQSAADVRDSLMSLPGASAAGMASAGAPVERTPPTAPMRPVAAGPTTALDQTVASADAQTSSGTAAANSIDLAPAVRPRWPWIAGAGAIVAAFALAIGLTVDRGGQEPGSGASPTPSSSDTGMIDAGPAPTAEGTRDASAISDAAIAGSANVDPPPPDPMVNPRRPSRTATSSNRPADRRPRNDASGDRTRPDRKPDDQTPDDKKPDDDRPGETKPERKPGFDWAGSKP